jgi:hypothetical protein
MLETLKFQKFTEISKALQPIHHNYDLNRTFHVTFALYKKKTVAIGINSIKTHPNIPKLDYRSEEGEDLRNIARMHSELNCVLKLQNKYGIEDLSDITFVNIRLDRMGNVRYAKPCNGCTHLLSQVGFKKLYYSLNNGEFEKF